MIREAASVSGTILRDEELLDEVTFSGGISCRPLRSFDTQFLSLPREVIIHSMKEHQRYFPVVDDQGKFLPHFVCISNIAPRNRGVVVKGNERVLKARLSDAAFFFHEDLKISLEKRVEQLKKVVFQAKLGTSYEKVMRFQGAGRISSFKKSILPFGKPWRGHPFLQGGSGHRDGGRVSEASRDRGKGICPITGRDSRRLQKLFMNTTCLGLPETDCLTAPWETSSVLPTKWIPLWVALALASCPQEQPILSG